MLLGLAFVFLVIGIDQSLVFGFQKSYWAFMLALTLFFTFTLRKGRQTVKDQESGSAKTRSGKSSPNKK
jgi:hypothetical protein